MGHNYMGHNCFSLQVKDKAVSRAHEAAAQQKEVELQLRDMQNTMDGQQRHANKIKSHIKLLHLVVTPLRQCVRKQQEQLNLEFEQFTDSLTYVHGVIEHFNHIHRAAVVAMKLENKQKQTMQRREISKLEQTVTAKESSIVRISNAAESNAADADAVRTNLETQLTDATDKNDQNEIRINDLWGKLKAAHNNFAMTAAKHEMELAKSQAKITALEDMIAKERKEWQVAQDPKKNAIFVLVDLVAIADCFGACDSNDFGWDSHNYIGHNYIGHNCIGHNCIGHSYIGHNYIGQNYVGHSYIGRDYIGHNYTGHNYIGHNYIGRGF